MDFLKVRGPWTFGSWTVHQLVEWETDTLGTEFLFPEVTHEAVVNAVTPGAGEALTPEGNLALTNQVFLFRNGYVTALADLGAGNGKPRPDEPWMDRLDLPYLPTLERLGVLPENVDLVFMPHFHQDHVGLATAFTGDSWIPTFPNARYVAHGNEWNSVSRLKPGDPGYHPSIDDSIRPLVDAGRMEWVKNGDSVRGIRVHEAFGHTPGMIVLQLENPGGCEAWLTSDLFHHPAQVTHPEWRAALFDLDGRKAADNRRRFLARFADEKAVFFSEHIRLPLEAKKDGSGYRPAFAEQPFP